MKIIGAIVIIIIAIILYIVIHKLVCWIFDFDKKTDIKMFKTELEDYDNDKQCALASIAVVFVIITLIVLFLFFTRC